MIRSLLAGAAALGLMVGVAQATPPTVWDGIIVPTAGNCSSEGPISWRATYRPYISDALSGHAPSQLVAFTDFRRNGFGFRLPSPVNNQFNTAQLNGQGQLITFFVGSEVSDKDTQSNAANAVNRNFDFVQDPPVIKLKNGKVPAYVKITGTILRSDNSAPGLRCASAIRGVFVQRQLPPAP